MGHNDGRITAPVSIYDIQQTLGDASQDLGSLANSANINRNARDKPIRHANVGEVSEAERKAANYGFQFNFANNAADLVQGVTYLKPDGDWWKRMNDFIGYEHNAQPPMSGIGDFSLSAVTAKKDIYFRNQKPAWINDLTLGEFPALANYYPCVVLFETLSNGLKSRRVKTGERTFAEGGDPVVELTRQEVGATPRTIEYMLCGFSAKKTSFDDIDVVGQYVSLPSDDALTGTVTIRSGISVDFEFVYITRRIEAGKNIFELVKTYNGPLNIDGTKNARFGVGTTGDIALVARITNNEEVAFTATRLSLAVSAYPTLITTAEPSRYSPSEMYEMEMSGNLGTATATTQLRVAPGECRWMRHRSFYADS